MKKEKHGKVSRKRESELRPLAYALLPMIRAYYESEEGQREFAEWKRNQDEKASGK